MVFIVAVVDGLEALQKISKLQSLDTKELRLVEQNGWFRDQSRNWLVVRQRETSKGELAIRLQPPQIGKYLVVMLHSNKSPAFLIKRDIFSVEVFGETVTRAKGLFSQRFTWEKGFKIEGWDIQLNGQRVKRVEV